MARILVADDEPSIRNIIRKALEQAGHEVVEAEDGVVALAAFKEQPADLVVVDIFMPEKDGLQLIAELRDEHPGTKIVAISGSVYERRPRFLEIAGRMESVATLAKPFSVDELLEAVKEALDP